MPRLHLRLLLWAAPALPALFAASIASAQGCDPAWLPTFDTSPGTEKAIRALAVFDDGDGPALIAAGDFEAVEGVDASRIAAWDGTTWSPLGGGLDARVRALLAFDDGSGPALFAAGDFTTAGGASANHVARWDGAAWSALGNGLSDEVDALAVFDDGSGPVLVAAGRFTSAGGQPASRVATWDGQGWSALGAGIDDQVFALAVFDDGVGPALYAGGSFPTAGGVPVNGVARWDGGSWSPLASGVSGGVRALTVFDDGTGPALYAGGLISSASGADANGVARWDGHAWSAVGIGILPGGPFSQWVVALTAFDDGTGPALYAAGDFTYADGKPAQRVARWDGQAWNSVSTGAGGFVRALAVFDDGSGAGSALFAGGEFACAGSWDAERIARWNGQRWDPLGKGHPFRVLALASFDDGSGAGPRLHAVGSSGCGGHRVLVWDGTSWSTVGAAFDGDVFALAGFDDGSGAGPALYAGGAFDAVGDTVASGIARWDGTSWSAFGGPQLGGVHVYALIAHDDGAGPALFAGGLFAALGLQPAKNAARWDGQGWSPLGAGTSGASLTGAVTALGTFDDGAGPGLFAGGWFDQAGGVAASRVARWDGQSWSALGAGLNAPPTEFATFDDGAGSALYAGGMFTTAGGASAGRIARWDGQGWSTLGSGLDSTVLTLAVADVGAGPALYAGGPFGKAGGVSASGVARWDGASWSPLGAGLSYVVRALVGLDDGAPTGPALFAGGDFATSPAGDVYVARWACPPSPIETLLGCFGNPAVLAALSYDVKIAGTFSASLTSAQIGAGLGVLFFGHDQTDAAGCGLFVPGIGELLLGLAPQPHQLASGALSAGAVAFDVPVPDQPSLVGVEVAFHGAVLGLFDPGLPIELSNGLVTTIAQ